MLILFDSIRLRSFRPDAIKFSPDESTVYVTRIGIIQERTITPGGAAMPVKTSWMYPNSGLEDYACTIADSSGSYFNNSK